MTINIKKFLVLTTIFASLMLLACWYNTVYYNDYIYGINNYENHTIATPNNITPTTTDYIVKNNMTVDLPLSISIKLAANRVENTDDLMEMSVNTVRCLLLYRILPYGDWVTVADKEFAPNSILDNSEPAFWLGRNNINPLGLKANSMIMVRLYVNRGMLLTGMLTSKCDKLLNDEYSLQNEFKYSIKKDGTVDLEDPNRTLVDDIGGAWLPQNVVTLKFSGKYRPIR